MAHQERLNIAVFIDFDNIEIGVKSTLGEHFDVGVILDAVKERGEVVTKIAYADWTRAGEYSRHLTQHAIRLVQRNLTPGGDKNGADINLALDALEMAFTHPHINAYVIVGGDSDFLSLVEKLKQYDKKVFVVGGRAFTSVILQRNCHEFIAYENLLGNRRSTVKGGRQVTPTAAANISSAFAIVRRALKILSDREVSPQTGLLKSTLLQLDSTFSERTYGASSFLDFVEKLAQSGLVQLKHSGRSVMVELNERFDENDAAANRQAVPEADIETALQPVAPAQPAVAAQAPAEDLGTPRAPQPDQAPVTQVGDQAEGVRIVARVLGAATTARWPMYLRNVKQILRAADSGFDERRYGFGGLMDLLRACQREGLIRLERDRRGGLRVFRGAGLPVPLGQPTPVSDTAIMDVENEEPADGELDTMARAPRPRVDEPLDVDNDFDAEPEPQPHTAIDTTAELLGRAKPKRPRARTTPAAAAPRAARKPAARKPATRHARSRKPARSGGNEN